MKRVLRVKEYFSKVLRKRRASALVFVGLFAVIGISALLLTRAATPSVAVQAERGLTQGNARIVSGDSTSSGNGYVIFDRTRQSPDFKGFYIFGAALKSNNTYCKTAAKPCPIADQIRVDEQKFLEHPLAAGFGMAASYWSKYQKTPNTFDWTGIDEHLRMLSTDAVKASNGGKPKNLIVRTYIGRSRAPASATKPHDCSPGVTDDKAVDTAAGFTETELVDEIPRFVFCPHNGRDGSKFFSWTECLVNTHPCPTNKFIRNFIPLFWDSSYQADFRDFRTALGNKIVGHENVMVALGGPYKAFEENFLPWSTEGERAQWLTKYNEDFDPDISTDPKNTQALKVIQDKYENFMTSYLFPTNARAFPGNQPLIFALGLGAGDNNNEKNNIYNSFGRTNYGAYAVGSNSGNRGWSIQFNGLQPDITPDPCATGESPPNCDGAGEAYVKKMINYIGLNWGPLATDPAKRGIIGYQFVGGVLPFATSNIKIAKGGFKQSIQNAINYKASYVEVYKSDFQAAYFYATRDTTRVYNEIYNDEEEKPEAEKFYRAMLELKDSLVSTKPPL